MKKDYKTYIRCDILRYTKGKIKRIYLLPPEEDKDGVVITIMAGSLNKLAKTLYNIITDNKNIKIICEHKLKHYGRG